MEVTQIQTILGDMTTYDELYISSKLTMYVEKVVQAVALWERWIQHLITPATGLLLDSHIQ